MEPHDEGEPVNGEPVKPREGEPWEFHGPTE